MLFRSEEIRYYEFTHENDINLLIFMAILYAILIAAIVIYFISKLFKDKNKNFRGNLFSIFFYIFLILGLVIRWIYFPGTIKPFCYSVFLYNILGDYPSLMQSISIILLVYKYTETLSGTLLEHNNKYNIFRKIIIAFGICYTLLFVSIHSIRMYKKNELFHTIYYSLITTGQFLILIAFTVLSHKITRQLGKVYPQYSSSILRLLLILFSILLGTRVVYSIVNLIMKENNFPNYIYIIFYIFFEVLPAVVLFAIYIFQEKKRKTTKKINIAELWRKEPSEKTNELDDKMDAIGQNLIESEPSDY